VDTRFDFRSPHGELLSAVEWVSTWAARFDAKKFPENIYRHLLEQGPALADSEIEILGAWKDGACRTKPGHNTTAVRSFGTSLVSFTGTWSPTAASCAYEVWQRLPQSRAILEECLQREDYLRFLSHLLPLA
jgi:hypothetical protein